MSGFVREWRRVSISGSDRTVRGMLCFVSPFSFSIYPLQKFIQIWMNG